MKKIIMMLVLLLSLSTVFAQSNGVFLNADTQTWSDSIYYGTPGDSVWIIKTNDFSKGSFRILLEGNANDPVDSLGIELGAYIRNSSGTVISAVYGSQISVKDSAWNTLQTLVNSSTGKDYSLYVLPPVELIKITLLNHRGTLATRKVSVIVQGAK